MKKLLLIVAAGLLMTACGNKTKQLVADMEDLLEDVRGFNFTETAQVDSFRNIFTELVKDFGGDKEQLAQNDQFNELSEQISMMLNEADRALSVPHAADLIASYKEYLRSIGAGEMTPDELAEEMPYIEEEEQRANLSDATDAERAEMGKLRRQINDVVAKADNQPVTEEAEDYEDF